MGPSWAAQTSGEWCWRNVLYLFRPDGENNPEQEGSVTSTCHAFRAKGTQCDSPGQRPGKCETKVQSPNGAKGSPILITPFQGSAARSCMFPGAMPQAFTLCRVAAKRIGNAIRGDGTKTGSTNTRNHPAFAQPRLILRSRIYFLVWPHWAYGTGLRKAWFSSGAALPSSLMNGVRNRNPA